MAGRWRVLSQRQYEELTPGGTFESVVDVTVQISSGTTFIVKIPSRLYTEEYVRETIEEHASRVIAVESLEG